MRGDDPEAMWRPGYTGSYGYAAAAPPRRNRWAAVAGVLALAAATIPVVLVSTRTGNDVVGPVAGPRVGVAADVRWQATLDGVDVTGAAGSADGVVVLVGPARTAAGSPDLVALDATTGERRWHLDLAAGGIDSVDVIDDVVVVSQTGKGDTAAVAGVPVGTGEIAWTRPIERYDSVTDEGGGAVAIVGARRIELVDVHDGTTVAAIDGDVSWTRTVTQRRRGDRLEVLDRDTLRTAAMVDLPAIGVGPDDEALAVVTPNGIVVASPGAVQLLDPAGGAPRDVVVGRQPDANSVGLEVLDDTGRHVAVQQGDRLVVMTTVGGELTELWSDTAWLVDWRVDQGHRLVAAARVLGSIISMPPVVLDAESGRPLWDGPAAVQQSSPLQVFADDGFVRITSTTRAGQRLSPVVIGYDLDRREVWRREVVSDSRVHLIDDGFVTIEDRSDSGVTVTLYA